MDWKKLLIALFILLGILVILLNVLSSSLLDTSILTLGKDAVAVINSPTLEEIKEIPVEDINENVQDFIENVGEIEQGVPIKLEDGTIGIRLTDDDVVVSEVLVNIKDGAITSMDYSGFPPNLEEDQIMEIPEQVFRVIVSGNTPESLPKLIEKFKEDNDFD